MIKNIDRQVNITFFIYIACENYMIIQTETTYKIIIYASFIILVFYILNLLSKPYENKLLS